MTRQMLFTQLFAIFGGFKEAWARHCLNVARLSRLIAKNIDGLNENFAFLYGLVHDIGRSTPRSHKDPRYHCVDGYMILNSLEKNARKESLVSEAFLLSQLKYSPLTHSFPDLNNLCLVPGYYNPLWDNNVQNKQDMQVSGIWDVFMPKMLKGHSPNTYDTIVCLADLMSASDKTVTIDERLEMVKKRYGNSPKEAEIKDAIQRSVEYIEKLAKKPIYEMVGMKREKE